MRLPRQDASYVLVALWTRMSAKWGLPVRIMAQKNSLKALFVGRTKVGFYVQSLLANSSYIAVTLCELKWEVLASE